VRSPKPYTNAYFTKRVDHDGGRHHTARAPAEPRVCEECGAVYVRRRWVAPTTATKRTIPVSSETKTVRCPACRQRQSGLPCGFVRASGPFLTQHLDEIERLLTNEAARVVDDNPTARIMTWDRATPGVLELTTTTPHLAQRLGHALEKAFGGAVTYDFSHENQVARVGWRRE
jgi:NMD protein affecting ribosome stability and mRNA decay